MPSKLPNPALSTGDAVVLAALHHDGQFDVDGIDGNAGHGRVAYRLGHNLTVTDAACDDTGAVVVTGTILRSAEPEAFVLRLLSSGAPDPQFGVGGVVVFLPEVNFARNWL